MAEKENFLLFFEDGEVGMFGDLACGGGGEDRLRWKSVKESFRIVVILVCRVDLCRLARAGPAPSSSIILLLVSDLIPDLNKTAKISFDFSLLSIIQRAFELHEQYTRNFV